jgi:hypothetical protein
MKFTNLKITSPTSTLKRESTSFVDMVKIRCQCNRKMLAKDLKIDALNITELILGLQGVR